MLVFQANKYQTRAILHLPNIQNLNPTQNHCKCTKRIQLPQILRIALAAEIILHLESEYDPILLVVVREFIDRASFVCSSPKLHYYLALVSEEQILQGDFCQAASTIDDRWLSTCDYKKMENTPR